MYLGCEWSNSAMQITSQHFAKKKSIRMSTMVMHMRYDTSIDYRISLKYNTVNDCKIHELS